MNIGILALQGAFAEHAAMLDRLGAAHFEIRQPRDLERTLDGLILPGGESTAMRKLLQDLELFEPLRQRILGGLPVFGTCAGLILLASSVEGGTPCFGTMDLAVRRNAYGRQLSSFYTEEAFDGKQIPMTFIRAPQILSAGPAVRILARARGQIVAAQQAGQLVSAFHPELSHCVTIHQHFLEMVQRRQVR